MSLRFNNQVDITLTQLALMFAVLVFAVFPTIYFFTAYTYESEHLQYQADLAADEISQIAKHTPDNWMNQHAQIKRSLARQQSRKSHYVRVINNQNAVLTALNAPLHGFTLTRSAKISNGNTILGGVEITMDFSSVINQLAVVLVLGFAIALTVYGVLKTVPLRALNKTMVELARSNKALQKEAGRRERLIEVLKIKNTELEHLTYTVPHDLKSPLITVRGFINLLERDLAEGNYGRVDQNVIQIKEAAEQMQQLLDDLLELSSAGRIINTAQEIDLNEMVARVVKHVAWRIERNQVQVSVMKSLPILCGDRVRIFEVVQNLIDNAVKFINPEQTPCVEISGWQEGEEVGCCIRDNGIGIELRHQEKIFGLFERLDNKTEGTGIGLALVKRIIEMHGGRVWLESEGLGRGTCICFALPKYPPGQP